MLSPVSSYRYYIQGTVTGFVSVPLDAMKTTLLCMIVCTTISLLLILRSRLSHLLVEENARY